MDSRLSGISQGAKDATAYGLFEKIKGLLPQFDKGPGEAESGFSDPNNLGDQIANVSRMVQEPDSDSSDWTDMQIQFLKTDNLEDLSEGDLRYLYSKVFGESDKEPYEMIEALESFREMGL